MQRFFLFTTMLLTAGPLAHEAQAAQAQRGADQPQARVSSAAVMPAPADGAMAPKGPSTAPADLATAPSGRQNDPVPTQVLATAINLAAQQKMPESFGAPHQLVLGGSSSFNVHGLRMRLQNQSANQLSISFDPWVGMFVCRHLLIGAMLPISYARGGGVWFANVGVGPLIAWHIPIGTHFALLPRVAAVYQFGRAQRSSTGIAEARTDSHVVLINARVDAVVHLSHHLSVVMGPYASQSVFRRSGGNKDAWQTFYGLHAGLLGWF